MDQTATCGDSLAFRLGDRERRLVGVRLIQHADLPSEGLVFQYAEGDGVWRLDLPRPDLWRLEYLLELKHPDGRTELVCDPDNPRRVAGAFGEKSVLECPEYATPDWLHAPAAAGSWRELSIPAGAIRAEVQTRIWSPEVPPDRMLVVHDGPEYDRLAGLGQYSAALLAAGRVPPYHLVLLAPGHRDEWYSANPAYARALVDDVLPRVRRELGTTGPVVGMGASLGALAMLHAQRRYPGAFAGLFLQSGSFFQPRHDSQESGFPRYKRIVRFVGRVLRATGGAPAVPTVLTCGLVEENRHNNRDLAFTLRRQGYPVELSEIPDAHNYTAWRDALDPPLTKLLWHVVS